MEIIVKDKKYLQLQKKASNKLKKYRIKNRLSFDACVEIFKISKKTLVDIEHQKGSTRPFIMENLIYNIEEKEKVK